MAPDTSRCIVSFRMSWCPPANSFSCSGSICSAYAATAPICVTFNKAIDPRTLAGNFTLTLGGTRGSTGGTGINFNQHDINTIERTVFISGDQAGTPWQNPQAHGSPAQRQNALSVGINGGAAACLKKLAPGFTR